MDIEFYSTLFKNLNVSSCRGVPAPHKAILLISVMDLIEDGDIASTQIDYTEKLKDRFCANWNVFVPEGAPFKCIMSTPFFHMSSEFFWDIIPNNGMILDRKRTPSESAIVKNFQYARITEDLFRHLSNAQSREVLKQTLIETYLTSHL